VTACLYIMGGALIGAPLRYILGRQVTELTTGTFPFATMAVNVSGCLLIGFVATLTQERHIWNRDAHLFLVVGLLGSYTTFSAFGWEMLALLREDQVLRAGAYAVVSTLGGLLAVWAGMMLGRQA